MLFRSDGAVEEGVFYESANFAAVKKLPVLFLCENNLYSVYTPLQIRQPAGRKIHDMVRGLGVNSIAGDGNDIEEVYGITAAAVTRIRNGEGPQFLEFYTYRHREHCGPNFDNDIGYRSEEEFQQWKNRDPITLYEAKLLADGVISQGDINDIQTRIAAQVDEAFVFAESSPFPAAADAGANIYAS